MKMNLKSFDQQTAEIDQAVHQLLKDQQEIEEEEDEEEEEQQQQEAKKEQDNSSIHLDQTTYYQFNQVSMQKAQYIKPSKTFSIHVQTYIDLDFYLEQEKDTIEYIILFDPLIELIRKLEMYQAINANQQLEIYFLMYKDSIEQQKYLSNLKNEQKAYEELIQQKSRLVLNTTSQVKTSTSSRIYMQNLQQKASSLQINLNDHSDLSSKAYHALKRTNNRRAGDSTSLKKEQVIIIDYREFMSSLPSYLHKYGFQLIPVTLLVADFVLSLYIAIERKGISDLKQSFISGRLYDQMKQMIRSYKQPALLIEFNDKDIFCLNTISDISNEINSNDLISKLVLLTLQYPTVQILWSRSPLHTAEIFMTLKYNRSQPIINKNLMVGIEHDDDDIDQELIESSATYENSLDQMTPYDMLLKIPGISNINIKQVLRHINTLHDLANASLKQCQEWLGINHGKYCYDFMNTDVSMMF